jgi:hypothetical protein
MPLMEMGGIRISGTPAKTKKGAKKHMPIIETETWVKHPEKPGVLVFDSQRPAKDVFNELEAHLKADGRLPDEYFLLNIDWW